MLAETHGSQLEKGEVPNDCVGWLMVEKGYKGKTCKQETSKSKICGTKVTVEDFEG